MLTQTGMVLSVFVMKLIFYIKVPAEPSLLLFQFVLVIVTSTASFVPVMMDFTNSGRVTVVNALTIQFGTVVLVRQV
jgi:hypothetical protein